ncbi:hypothetical protein [Succinimonas sp.]|uniref:hypothetical protein n=1 Tax=Succinimonas sp. TaxID=1936151 RepID=UPI0038638145
MKNGVRNARDLSGSQNVLKPPEIKDFGTSFRISLSRKPLKTDDFGVVNPLRALSAGIAESDTNRSTGIGGSDTNDTD